MGSLSLLQRIFPIQELNQGLLHFRWILYQLSYQGNPTVRQGVMIGELWAETEYGMLLETHLIVRVRPSTIHSSLPSVLP